MSDSALLACRLKKLRERAELSVTQLSIRSGLAESAIYKAEQGSRTVRWRSIATAYECLCETPRERLDLLLAWALDQSDMPLQEDEARAQLDALLQESGRARSAETVAMIDELQRMPLAHQRLLAAFTRVFRESALARRLAGVFVEQGE